MQGIINIQYVVTPYGELIIGDYEGRICLCDWHYRKKREAIDRRIKLGLKAEYYEKGTDIIKETINQLDEYFAENRIIFDIPLLFTGSEFQRKVWHALTEIPYGETSTYLQLSKKLGNEKAIRAVAAANGANAISIIVPCHRIIGSNGEMVGYAGGISSKMRLLKLEKAISSDQLSLF